MTVRINRVVHFIALLVLCFGIKQSALAQTPVLTIPSGHSAWIPDAAISTDGKYFVTGSYDNTVKIWDYASRREVKTLYGHSDIVQAIAISPDNRLIASAAADGKIKIWQVNNGRLVKTFEFSATVMHLAFSPDSRLLAGSTRTKKVFVRDLKADSILWWGELYGVGGKVQFFPDGTHLAAIDQMPKGQNNELSVYETNSGTYIQALSFSYKHGDIKDFSLSPTGKYAFCVVNTDSSNVRIRDLGIKKDVLRLKGHVNRPAWVAAGATDDIFYTAAIISYPKAGRKTEIKKWNWKTGRCIDSIMVSGTNSVTEKLLYSAKNDQLIIPASSIAFSVLDANPVRLKGTIRGFTSLINDFHEFPGGRFLVNADDGGVKEINLATGLFQNLVPATGLAKPAIFQTTLTADSSAVIARMFQRGLVKINLHTKAVQSFTKKDTIVSAFIFDKETQLFATNTMGPKGNDVTIIDTSGNTIISRHFGDKKKFYVNTYTFLPGKKLAIRISAMDSLIVWDFSRNEVSYLPDASKGNYVWYITYLGNNRLVEGDYSGKLSIRNLSSNQIEKEWQKDSAAIYSIKIDPQSKRMLTVSNDGYTRLWNTENMELLKSFSANKSWVTHASFTRLPGVIYSYGMDNSIHFWNINSGAEMAAITILDTIQYVVTKPGGLFDASPEAMKLMYYVVNDSLDTAEPWKIIELEQLKHRYYQPGLLQIQLGYSKEKLRDVPLLNTVELAPAVNSSIINNQLIINLKNQRGGIGPVAIYLDGAELTADARLPANRSKDLPSLTVRFDLSPYLNRLIPGKNSRIKVIAWNGGKWISSRPDTLSFVLPASAKGVIVKNAQTTSAPVKPKLYALVFGTSDYAGQQIDLKYSSKDAVDFANALKLAAQSLFGAENTEVNLFDSEEKQDAMQPDKKNFIACMASLAKRMNPWDVLVIYLSGHGVNYGGADGDFYYLTRQASGADAAYLSDPQVRENAAISSNEMTALLNKISAKKKILILDACASGRAAEAMLAAARDVPASQVRAIDRMKDRTGFYILSGSASDAVSYESSVYGQGLLTYALLKALRGAALRIDGSEEFVDIQKLLSYAVDEVPLLAKGIGGTQKPLYRSPDDQQSFDIGKMDEAAKRSIVISEPKPVFVATGFQDPVQLTDDLELSEKINASIRENTTKGKSADFIFTEAKDYPGAYRITGTYEKKGSILALRYVLTKDKVRIGSIRGFEADFAKPEVFVAAFLNELKTNLGVN
jgi:WD40 repeat protein/uncharacterized caspase-like protein